MPLAHGCYVSRFRRAHKKRSFRAGEGWISALNSKVHSFPVLTWFGSINCDQGPPPHTLMNSHQVFLRRPFFHSDAAIDALFLLLGILGVIDRSQHNVKDVCSGLPFTSLRV